MVKATPNVIRQHAAFTRKMYKKMGFKAKRAEDLINSVYPFQSRDYVIIKNVPADWRLANIIRTLHKNGLKKTVGWDQGDTYSYVGGISIHQKPEVVIKKIQKLVGKNNVIVLEKSKNQVKFELDLENLTKKRAERYGELLNILDTKNIPKSKLREELDKDKEIIQIKKNINSLYKKRFKQDEKEDDFQEKRISKSKKIFVQAKQDTASGIEFSTHAFQIVHKMLGIKMPTEKYPGLISMGIAFRKFFPNKKLPKWYRDQFSSTTHLNNSLKSQDKAFIPFK